MKKKSYIPVKKNNGLNSAGETERQKKLLNATLSSISDLTYGFDTDGKIIYANQAMLNIWQLPLEKVIGKSFLELGYSPNQAIKFQHQILQVIGTRQPLRDEMVHFTNGIIYGAYEYILVPVFDEQGKAVAVAGSSRDVTERKAQEEKQTFLLNLSDALRTVTDAGEVQATACWLIGKHLNVDRAYFGEINEAEGWVRVREHYGRSDSPSMAGTYRLVDYGWSLPIMRRGETVIFDDLDHNSIVPEEFRPALRAIQILAHIAVPIIRNGLLVGIFCVTEPEPRIWTPGELSLMHEVIDRMWAYFQRARAETALRESEERFRSYVEVSSDLVYRMSGDWKEMYILNANEFMVDTEQTSRDWQKRYIPKTERAKVRAEIIKAIRNKSIFSLEHRVILADGKTGWVHSSALPIIDENGNIKEWRGAARDITLRKQAEEERYLYKEQLEQQVTERTAELRQQYALQQTMLDTTLIGMSVFEPVRDAAGTITDFKIIVVNKKIERSSGRNDMIGKLYAELFPGIKKMGLFDLMVKTIETGQTGQMEYNYQHEGFDRWYSTMFVKGDDILVSTNLDITDRKRAEQKMREMEYNQQLEIFRVTLRTQEEERRRISESLHNGLGQVLYGIKMSLSQLKASKAVSNAGQYEIDRNYTSKLLSDAIRDTRRISHELMPSILDEFGLEAAVNEVCKQMQDGVKFDCSIELNGAELDKYMQLAVFRTLQELMINVVRHARATKATAHIGVHEGFVFINVEDNGQGINPEKAGKDGIGLASIRSKVGLLNGSCHIDSAPGKGTSVNITLPYILKKPIN